MIRRQATLANGNRGAECRVRARIVVRIVLERISQLVQIVGQPELGCWPGPSVNGDRLAQQPLRTGTVAALPHSAGQDAQGDSDRAVSGAQPLAPDLERFGQYRFCRGERGFGEQDRSQRIQLVGHLEAPRSALSAGDQERAPHQAVCLIEQPELQVDVRQRVQQLGFYRWLLSERAIHPAYSTSEQLPR